MRRRKPMTQDEAVRYVWYNQSEWGKRRKRRIAAFWLCVGFGAVVGILLGLLVP